MIKKYFRRYVGDGPGEIESTDFNDSHAREARGYGVENSLCIEGEGISRSAALILVNRWNVQANLWKYWIEIN